jgi:hypothetical protein
VRAVFSAGALAALLASAGSSWGQPTAVDRVVVRFDAPESGGQAHPQFIFERELAFEARLEALADTGRADRSRPYIERHVRAALERHVAEELLAHLAVERVSFARTVLEQRVGGSDALGAAARAEGIGAGEIDNVVRREARASLYLDRMVAPMLEPSEAELREVHRSNANPFSDQRFEDVVEPLRRWYVAERLETAVGSFFQNARGRVHVAMVKP